MTKRTAWAMPVLPGKTEQLHKYYDELTGPRRQEGIDFGKKWNLKREVDFLQHTPNGDFLIITWEGDDLEKFMKDSIKNPDEYTKWNMQQMQEITGAEPPKEGSQEEWPLPEMVVDTGLPVPDSSKIIAFIAPILPGKTDASKKFVDELNGARKQEFDESRKKMNVRERDFLQKSPQGDVIIVTLTGENPESALKEFAQGQDEFTRWFIQQVNEIYGFNLSETTKQPFPELLMDTSELEKETVAVG
jgi:hypothetical protein